MNRISQKLRTTERKRLGKMYHNMLKDPETSMASIGRQVGVSRQYVCRLIHEWRATR